MKAPKRLLDGPLSPDKRRVLEASLASGPSNAARERIWAGLSPHLAQVGTAAATLAGAESASAATKLGAGMSGGTKVALVSGAAPSITKVLLGVVLAVSGATVAGNLLVQREARSPEAPPARAPSASLVIPQRPPPPQASARQVATPDALPTPTDIEVDSLPARPSPQLTSASPADREQPSTPAGRLAAESALVAKARDSLRAGEFGSCLTRLHELDRDFAGGVMTQERSVLKIEVLTQVGQREYARELAQDFARRYPESPYLARVRELVGWQAPRQSER